MAVFDTMSLDNEVFKAYLFYQALLILKMLAMSFLTGMQRFKNKAFANPEDAGGYKLKPRTHEDVERVRRAHMNDLENIPLFFVSAWLYTLTNPAPVIAINLFRAYVAARYLHTFVYAIYVVPQPARALSFGVGMIITVYMTVTALLHLM